MLILPAIDLLQGRCVRLRQGRFDKATVYSDDPVGIARRFADDGAQALHIVDLEGARDGIPRNLDWVRRIRAELSVRVQVGGGIRTLEAARELLSTGVDRVVLGTAAVEDSRLLADLLESLGSERVAASVDVRDGRPTVHGWTEDSQRSLADVLAEMRGLGLRHLVCTDVSRDGILAGPSLELTRRMVGEGFQVIAAGGVTTGNDVARLREVGAAGCIIGSALYTGALTLAAALEAAGAD